MKLMIEKLKKLPAPCGRVVVSVSKWLISEIQELALVAGFIALFYGIHQIYPPAAWIINGVLLMVFGAWDLALFASRVKGKAD